MEIKNKNINDLIFAEYNPRKLTKKEHQQLKESLTRFGLVDPIIINTHSDRENIIIGGHQRVRIWKELGHKTIPTIEINLDYNKEKELNVRLNKNVGSWDFDSMANFFEVEELKEYGFKESEIFGDFISKETQRIPDDCIIECYHLNQDCMGAKIWEAKTGCKFYKENSPSN